MIMDRSGICWVGAQASCPDSVQTKTVAPSPEQRRRGRLFHLPTQLYTVAKAQ